LRCPIRLRHTTGASPRPAAEYRSPPARAPRVQSIASRGPRSSSLGCSLFRIVRASALPLYVSRRSAPSGRPYSSWRDVRGLRCIAVGYNRLAMEAARRPARELRGRSQEMERVTHALGDADRGRLRLLFVSGEAGIGKTRLGEEIATTAEA